MSSAVRYPGTPQHQALLRALVAHYQDDRRILAIAVFGSLGRGSWDNYSDLDLDIVLADGVEPDVPAELRQLCDSFAGLGERALLITPDGADAGDIVLASLMGLSIRYHQLHNTSPNIVDSLLLLAGRISAEAIRAAGRANQRAAQPALETGLEQCLRLAVNASISLERQQFWLTLPLLHQMRELLLGVFASARGGKRPYHSIQQLADPALQARLGATLPGFSLPSAQQALAQLLDLLEQDLDLLSQGQLQLQPAHRELIAAIRSRQAQLRL